MLGAGAASAFTKGYWGLGILALVTLLLVNIGLIWGAGKLRKSHETQQQQMVEGLLESLTRQYPEEVQLIGGRAVLVDQGRLAAVLGVLRQPPKGEASGAGG
jgi:hypothetical protein